MDKIGIFTGSDENYSHLLIKLIRSIRNINTNIKVFVINNNLSKNTK